MLAQAGEQSYERDEAATAAARNFIVPFPITLPIPGIIITVAVGLSRAAVRARDTPPGAKVDVDLEATRGTMQLGSSPVGIGFQVTVALPRGRDARG